MSTSASVRGSTNDSARPPPATNAPLSGYPGGGSQFEKVKSRLGVFTGNVASVKSPSVEPAVSSTRSL